MYAQLIRDKRAVDIETGTAVDLLAAGTWVTVERAGPLTFRVADHALAGLLLADHEVDVYLTVEEFARRVNRTPATIHRWLSDGVISGEKVSGKGHGGQWRVPHEELDNLRYPKPGPQGGEQ